MDPQLEEYRRRQRERRAGSTAVPSADAGESAVGVASAGAGVGSALETRYTVPGLGAEAPLWQLLLALLCMGMLWTNVVRPYLYAWLLIGGLLGVAAWADRHLRPEGEPSHLEGLARVVGNELSQKHHVFETEVVGWHAAGGLLLLTLFLGPWVLGWAMAASLGLWAWQNRVWLQELGQGFLQHFTSAASPPKAVTKDKQPSRRR